jgi:hypothetical protein
LDFFAEFVGEKLSRFSNRFQRNHLRC